LKLASDLILRLVILVRFEFQLQLVNVIDACIFEGMNVSPLGTLVVFDLRFLIYRGVRFHHAG
jgi:hypothetical protein